MERLTKRYVDGMAYVPIDDVSRLNEECVGLPITKLAEYEDAEEKGLLIRLPCKIGDTVYKIEDDCNRPADCGYNCENCPDGKQSVYAMKFSAELIDDIGETVFFTRKEAEKKLKEMDG